MGKKIKTTEFKSSAPPSLAPPFFSGKAATIRSLSEGRRGVEPRPEPSVDRRGQNPRPSRPGAAEKAKADAAKRASGKKMEIQEGAEAARNFLPEAFGEKLSVQHLFRAVQSQGFGKIKGADNTEGGAGSDVSPAPHVDRFYPNIEVLRPASGKLGRQYPADVASGSEKAAAQSSAMSYAKAGLALITAAAVGIVAWKIDKKRALKLLAKAERESGALASAEGLAAKGANKGFLVSIGASVKSAYNSLCETFQGAGAQFSCGGIAAAMADGVQRTALASKSAQKSPTLIRMNDLGALGALGEGGGMGFGAAPGPAQRNKGNLSRLFGAAKARIVSWLETSEIRAAAKEEKELIRFYSLQHEAIPGLKAVTKAPDDALIRVYGLKDEEIANLKALANAANVPLRNAYDYTFRIKRLTRRIENIASSAIKISEQNQGALGHSPYKFWWAAREYNNLTGYNVIFGNDPLVIGAAALDDISSFHQQRRLSALSKAADGLADALSLPKSLTVSLQNNKLDLLNYPPFFVKDAEGKMPGHKVAAAFQDTVFDLLDMREGAIAALHQVEPPVSLGKRILRRFGLEFGKDYPLRDVAPGLGITRRDFNA